MYSTNCWLMCVYLPFLAYTVIISRQDWNSPFFNWQINKPFFHYSEVRANNRRPKSGYGNMVRQLDYFVLPLVCSHDCSHVNGFNWLSRPNPEFSASALHCQIPRGLLLHLKRNQRAREESIFPDSCPVIWCFLLCFTSPSMPHWNQDWHVIQSQPTVCPQYCPGLLF